MTYRIQRKRVCVNKCSNVSILTKATCFSGVAEENANSTNDDLPSNLNRTSGNDIPLMPLCIMCACIYVGMWLRVTSDITRMGERAANLSYTIRFLMS